MEVKNEHRFTALEDSVKSAHKRIDEVIISVNDLKDLIGVVSTLATNQGNMKEKLDKVSENVETIMMQPAKRWETVVVGIITAVIGIMAGMMFGGM